MKPLAIAGVLLIAVGIAALAYQGITYTSRDTVLDIGPLHATADREHTPEMFGKRRQISQESRRPIVSTRCRCHRCSELSRRRAASPSWYSVRAGRRDLRLGLEE